MGARTRVSDARYGEGGSYLTVSSGVTTNQSPITVGHYLRTEDVIGNREGVNPLLIDRYFHDGGWLEGYRLNSALTAPDRVYSKWRMAFTAGTKPDPYSSTHGFPIDALELNRLAWLLLSKTNPGTPDISVPQFLGEMKDLPQLLRGWGKHILRDVAQSHLTWRWFAKPLINDLSNLIRVKELSEKRFKELDRLRRGVKLGRRKQLDKGMRYVEGSNVILESAATAILRGYLKTTSTNKVWGSVQWYAPNWSPLREYDDKDLMILSKKLVTGMTGWNALATAWELLPWSWLYDWFSNVGNIINALHNQTLVKYRNICIMQTAACTTQVEFTTDLGPRYANTVKVPLTWVRTKKRRLLVPTPIVFPDFRLPVLTNGKLSIIAALSILRIPEGSRAAYKQLGKI